MELTVEVLREARFREGWRGYNEADVDEFIDQVSVGVQALHDRINELTLRAERAETRTAGENDETVKRTLVLAQRAADLVVSEAKSVAERIVADARRDAERIVGDATTEAAQRRELLLADAGREAEQRSAELHRAHQEQMARLAADRQVAEREQALRQAELDELRAHALAARDRLRSALTDHLVRIERLGEIGEVPPAPAPLVAAPEPAAPAAPGAPAPAAEVPAPAPLVAAPDAVSFDALASAMPVAAMTGAEVDGSSDSAPSFLGDRADAPAALAAPSDFMA
jgi:cell division initiation protein